MARTKSKSKTPSSQVMASSSSGGQQGRGRGRGRGQRGRDANNRFPKRSSRVGRPKAYNDFVSALNPSRNEEPPRLDAQQSLPSSSPIVTIKESPIGGHLAPIPTNQLANDPMIVYTKVLEYIEEKYRQKDMTEALLAFSFAQNNNFNYVEAIKALDQVYHDLLTIYVANHKRESNAPNNGQNGPIGPIAQYYTPRLQF